MPKPDRWDSSVAFETVWVYFLAVFTSLLSICQDIRQHKFLALRAVIIGNVALLLVWIIFAQKLADLDDWLFVTGLADIRYFWKGGRATFSHFLIGGGLNLFVGWIVGRTHRQHRTAMVSAFFTSIVLVFDIPRVLHPLVKAGRSGRDALVHFVSIGFVDFALLRLPILIGGICCVRNVNPGHVFLWFTVSALEINCSISYMS